MAKASTRKRGVSLIQAQIPPGFQGEQYEESVEEVVLDIEVHEAQQRPDPYRSPESLWNHLEPAKPQPKTEIHIEVEVPVPPTLIEQVLMESAEDSTSPYVIQPRFSRTAVIDEVVEERRQTAMATTASSHLQAYHNLWTGEDTAVEQGASAEELMLAATDKTDEVEPVSVAPAPVEQTITAVEEVSAEPAQAEVEELVDEPAQNVEVDELQPLPAFFENRTLEQEIEAAEDEPVEVADTAVQEERVTPPPPAARESIKPSIFEPADKPKTSMLDAVHALATETVREQPSETVTEEEEPQALDAAPSTRHTEQVAEAIRMIEEADLPLEEQAAASAVEMAAAEQASLAVAQLEDEKDGDMSDEENPHFDDALDKIAGTSRDDTISAQRREAIRHFTENKSKQRTQRRNQVETGAPGVVSPQPPSVKGGVAEKVEMETLGGGVVNLVKSGVQGLFNIGHYSAAGVKYGLKDSKSALKKITSKS